MHSGTLILQVNSVWMKGSLLPGIICMQYENTKIRLKLHLKLAACFLVNPHTRGSVF